MRASYSMRWNRRFMSAGPCGAAASSITRIAACNMSRSNTPSAWPLPASSPQSAASAIPTTPPWPKPSTVSTRLRSFTGAGRGARSRRSSSPPWNGWTGSTTAASWSPSAPCRRPKPRNTTTLCWSSPTWQHDSNQTASEEPGAVHVAIEMHHAALPEGLGEEFCGALEQAHAGVGDDQLDAAQPTPLEMVQEGTPAGLVFLGALDDAEDLPVALGIDRNRHQQRDVAHLAGPAALEHDAVEIEIGMFALDRLVPPGLDLAVDPLVEVGYRARADPRAPQRFGDVLDAADRFAGLVLLDQRFIPRALPPPITLDDRRLEGLPAQLGKLQPDLARLGLQLAVVAAGALIAPSRRPLIATRVA